MQSLIRSRNANPEQLPSLSFGHTSLAHILSNLIDLKRPAERAGACCHRRILIECVANSSQSTAAEAAKQTPYLSSINELIHLEYVLISSSSKVVQTIPLVESSQKTKPPLQDFPTSLEQFSHSPAHPIRGTSGPRAPALQRGPTAPVNGIRLAAGGSPGAEPGARSWM